METISKDDARQFLVNYHNLNGSQNYSGIDGVLKYMQKVRSIQYDPLNVVGRNADLVLQSKIEHYKPEMLHKLLYSEHALVDGSDKEMCIYITDDYERFERIRAASGVTAKNTLAYRNQLDALDILDDVRSHISKYGVISSKDLSLGKSQESRWGHKKLSSAALDYLYTIGELCVVNKNGTQKAYDFTKNVIPSQANQKDIFNDDNEFLCWYIKRRIGSVGMVWDKNGAAWQGHFLSDKKTREYVLECLLEEGHITKLYVEGIKSPFYIRKVDENLLLNPNKLVEERVKFLAPLDNILWDREMVKQLFDYEYRWEVYTPVDKRKYGYYVLPVLYGNKLIARFEPEKVKKNTPFTIKHWWWEADVNVTADLLESVNIAIHEFCEYLDVECLQDYDKVLRSIL